MEIEALAADGTLWGIFCCVMKCATARAEETFDNPELFQKKARIKRSKLDEEGKRGSV